MALLTTSNVKISGICACVPRRIEDNFDSPLIPEKDRSVFGDTIGIRYRRIADKGVTASDLCFTAAEKLLDNLSWNRTDLDVLIFVTQTADYIIPNTSSILQQRLGLSKRCLAFDINLGCSGYVYGLSVVSSLLQNISGGKALLLVGDCSTSVISPSDKSTYPLFSDAGSATAIERCEGDTWHFNLQTDGTGYEDIMIKSGGMRHPFQDASIIEKKIDDGVYRNDLQMKLDGTNIFNFALREVAANIQSLLEQTNSSLSNVDFVVFHQANKLMIENICRKLKLDIAKVPLSLYDFGNTSSASIPVTIVTRLAPRLFDTSATLILAGFGVGLSWGSAYLTLDKATILPVMEI